MKEFIMIMSWGSGIIKNQIYLDVCGGVMTNKLDISEIAFDID